MGPGDTREARSRQRTDPPLHGHPRPRSPCFHPRAVLPAGGARMNVAAILRQKGRAVTTASPSITLLEVAQRLAHKRIGAIVVVDAHGELIGIVSERDIIRA